MTDFIFRPAARLIALTLFAFVLAPAAHAQQAQPGWKDTSFATKEQVAFAFFRLSGIKLDIGDMIRTSPAFASLSPLDQETFFPDLFARTNEAYARFSPLTTPLVVGIPVQVETVAAPPALSVRYPGRVLPDFSFQVAGRQIILQSNDFLYYTLISLPDRDVLRRKSFQIENGMRAIAEIIPYRAIPAQKIGERDILLGHIARFRLVNFGGKVIWSDENPTYQSIYDLGFGTLFRGLSDQATPHAAGN